MVREETIFYFIWKQTSKNVVIDKLSHAHSTVLIQEISPIVTGVTLQLQSSLIPLHAATEPEWGSQNTN